MNQTSNIIADPSVRQVEFLNYVPAVMTYEANVNNLNIEALRKAVSFFVKRHESVRTVFPLIDGEVKQMILPYDDERFSIEFVDTGILNDEAYWVLKNQYYKKIEEQFTNKQDGPLVKFFLFKSGDNKHTFLLLIDHIICDAWSIQKIIKEEIIMFYNSYAAGAEPNIPPLKAQLREYCAQQKKWLQQEKKMLSIFWKTKLAGYDERFDINSYYAGYFLRNKKSAAKEAKSIIKTQKQFLEKYEHPESHLYTFKISGETFSKIKRMAETNKCTMSAIAYASLYIYLYCYTGKNKLLMAAFIADRFAPANRQLIGLLIGTVYFPREVSDNITIREFINQTLYDILTNCQNIIFSHEQLELDEKKINMGFDVLVNYIKIDTATPTIAELNQKHLAILGSPYVLESMIQEYDDSFVIYWKYKPLFDKDLIEDMVSYYSSVLDIIAENSNKTIGELKQALTRKVA